MNLNLEGNGAAYIRVSTEEQDVQRQYQTIQKTLERENVSPNAIEYFEDKGFARDETDRPEFQRLLDKVKTAGLDWVLVDQQDRFGTKDPEDFVHLRSILKDNNCRLLTCDGQDLTKEDICTLIVGILGAEKSLQEQRDKSYRVLGGQAVKAKAGLYMGGLPPFAMDVICFESERDFTEVWRIVYEGKYQRVKVLPNGESVRYDGKNNVPKPERGQVTRLWPSNNSRKLDAVRLAFSSYATESISFTRLSGKLNRAGFRAGGGANFTSENIIDMLSNPVYIGRPSWNKRHVGKFHKWSGGSPTKVRHDGKRCFENQREDWIVTEEAMFPPIVDLDIWDRVQLKLSERDVKPRASRNADFGLSGLVICGHCGKAMSGSTRHRRNGTTELEYLCSTNHDAISAGMTGECECLRHTTKQDFVLGLIENYVEDVGRELTAVRESAKSGVLTPVEQYRSRYQTLWGDMLGSIHEMFRYVQARVDDGSVSQLDLRCDPGDLDGIVPLYTVLRSEELSQLDAEYDRLDEDHTRCTNRLLEMDDETFARGRKKIEKRLADLETMLSDIEMRRENQSERFETAERMLTDVEESISTAKDAFKKESEQQASRQKNEAIRGAIQSIKIWYAPLGSDEPVPTGRRRKGGSKPVKIRITPTVGEPFERGLNEGRVTSGCSLCTD